MHHISPPLTQGIPDLFGNHPAYTFVESGSRSGSNLGLDSAVDCFPFLGQNSSPSWVGQQQTRSSDTSIFSSRIVNRLHDSLFRGFFHPIQSIIWPHKLPEHILADLARKWWVLLVCHVVTSGDSEHSSEPVPKLLTFWLQLHWCSPPCQSQLVLSEGTKTSSVGSWGSRPYNKNSRLLRNCTIGEKYIWQTVIPVLPSSINCLGQHVWMCTVEPLNQSICLRMVSGCIKLLDVHEAIDFKHKRGEECTSTIHDLTIQMVHHAERWSKTAFTLAIRTILNCSKTVPHCSVNTSVLICSVQNRMASDTILERNG